MKKQKKTIKELIDGAMREFSNNFQQAKDDIGYFGWEQETEYGDVERFVRDALIKIAKVTAEEIAKTMWVKEGVDFRGTKWWRDLIENL